MNPVYLDHNATTRVDARVVAEMFPYFTEHFANASSKHAGGTRAAQGVLKARRQIQALIGARSESEIVFTSGGTEADNLAIQGALDLDPNRQELVISAVEHPAVLALADHLHRTRGILVHRIGVDGQGRLDREAYSRVLGSRTALVSMMWANNETGTIFPIAELAAEARVNGALFHTDAVQAAGRIPLAVADLGIDLLSLSAHKFHGPKGVGALYLRQGVKLKSLLKGGRQERGMRPGTENVPGIVGAGAAAALCTGLEAAARRQGGLRDRLETGLLQRIPDVLVVGDVDHRLANTLCLAFDLVEGDDVVTLLSRAEIQVSSGSACASGNMEPSHVLRAMRVPFGPSHGAVRFSLGHDTTAADIERVLEVLPGVIAKLRDASETRGVA